MDSRRYIAKRAAKELSDGDIVNLGIGIPTQLVDYLPEDMSIYLHSENGILGVGPTPSEEEIDNDLVNAGKMPVSVREGAAYFDSATSFAMIRGGHIDVSVLGVLQIDEKGRIANWAIPRQDILGVGGAMDLLEGSKKVIVTMQHLTRNGAAKIVKQLDYPQTSERKVDIIVTEMAVFHVEDNSLKLVEIAADYTLKDIKNGTSANFNICESLLKGVK